MLAAHSPLHTNNSSCVLLFYSLCHDEIEGSPLSRHARTRRDLESQPEHELGDNETDRETKDSNDLDPESRMMGLGREHEKAGKSTQPGQHTQAPAQDSAAPNAEPAQPAPAITHV